MPLQKKLDLTLFLLLLGLGVISRWIPHPPNFSPLLALTFLANFLWPRKFLSLLLLMGIFVFSDLLLGSYPGIFWNYFSFLIAGSFAFFLRSTPPFSKWIFCSALASLVFFLLSNLGVFFWTTLYPKTSQGLFECYLKAVPFLRNSLFGDLLFSSLAFFLAQKVSKLSLSQISQEQRV